MACAEDRHATRSPYTHRMPTPEPVQPLCDAEVSKVARLAIPGNRLHPRRDQLAAVLTYIDRLRRLDLRSIEPMARVGEGANRFDDDAPGSTVANSDLMRSVPGTTEPFIKAPKVLGEGEGA